MKAKKKPVASDPQDWKEIREEKAYWQKFAKLSDVKLYGWNGKYSATFYNPRTHVHFDMNPNHVAMIAEIFKLCGKGDWWERRLKGRGWRRGLKERGIGKI